VEKKKKKPHDDCQMWSFYWNMHYPSHRCQ
jgi:hypothetical protein